MRAVVLKKYGSPSDLTIEERECPEPGADEVLVEVVSAGVNDWDWSLVRGKPFYIRLLCGLRKPKVEIPGIEIAGRVTKIGDGVDAFSVGDRVYGDLSAHGFGGFAEFVAVKHTSLRTIPEVFSFDEASAIPHAAMLALQGLKDIGRLEPGQTVLINGAGGGVGVIGVQLAKRLGASRVVGVDHTRKLSLMQEIGFDRVIDYTKHDFTCDEERFDLILDAKTSRKASVHLRALKPGGCYVTIGGDTDKLLRVLLFSFVSKRLTGKRVKVLGLVPNRGLEEFADMFLGERLQLVIDRSFSLAQMAKAIQHFGSASHLGKVVVHIQGECENQNNSEQTT